MKENEIIEGNKMIAEFVGYVEVDGIKFDLPHNRDHAHEYEYHSSWDWLMPVVEKIENKQLCSVCIKSKGTRIRVFNFETLDGTIFEAYPKNNTQDATKLSVTYSAVIRFIEWYNHKNQKQ